MTRIPAFMLEPQYRDYVWGGQRLRPGQLTAETWAIYEGDMIRGGPFAGRTLAEATLQAPEDLLGTRPLERLKAQTAEGGPRFPLLVKLLDCADWLSLQVHPDDAQAAALAGPGNFGKTEAWHVLQADPGAEILAGFEPGVPREEALRAVREGSLLDYTRRIPLQAGDTVFIRAGTLHALGPGLLMYEVQQTSDITYRVFDWNRPASAGRKLHIDESLLVLDTSAAAQPIPPAAFEDGALQKRIASPYFHLSLLTAERIPAALNPDGKSFHAVTCIEGGLTLDGEGWTLLLEQYQSAVVPASAGGYHAVPRARSQALVAWVG